MSENMEQVMDNSPADPVTPVNHVEERPLDIAAVPLNASAMIGASAGTGKTYTITYLVLRLLLGSGGATGFGRPLSLDELLVVTFTKAAASDLKERVREKICQARRAFEAVAGGSEPEAPDPALAGLIAEMTSGEDRKGAALKCSRLLLAAERGIDDAAISTIHSFANDSLNRIYSFEAGAAFEVELTEEQGLAKIRDRARLEIWRALFYRDDASSRALLKMLGVSDPEGLSEYESLLSKAALPYGVPGVRTVLGYAVKGEELERFSSFTSANGLKKALLGYALEREEEARRIDEDFKDKWRGYAGIFTPAAGFEERVAELKPNKAARGLIALILENPGEPSLERLSAGISGDYASYGAFGDGIFGKNYMKRIPKLKGDDQALAAGLVDACHCVYLHGRKLNELHRSGTLVAGTVTAVLILNRLDELCRAQDRISMDGLLLSLDRALHDKERGETLAEVLRRRYPVAMIDEFQDTDPVQFSIFRKLYLERGRSRACCFLIGDPKQSIYRFRNADIHSYIFARSELSASGSGGVYTLDTNYRSSAKVVEGVNCVFSGFPGREINDDPFADHDQSERIPYPKVKSGGGKLRLILDDMENEEAGNVVYFEHTQPLDKTGRVSVQVKCERFLAQAAAQAVLRCLAHGYLEDKKGNRRRVRTSDIAVLVRGVGEYGQMAAALSQYDIPCVYYSDRTSVLKTEIADYSGRKHEIASESARSVLALMEAMNGYFSQGKVLKLMGTPLSCLEGREFCALSSDADAFERETEILRECAASWERFGFLSAFTLWMKRHDTMRSLLSEQGGERRLTDCLQIAEILQSQHGVLFGAEAQIRYLRDLIEHDGQGMSPDETRRRLESERAQVKIYTIHKSKGLEFPVVILPFLWGKYGSSGKKSALSPLLPKVAYSPRAHRRVLVSGDPDGAVAAAAAREELQEDRRLLYVALTRACAANFLFISSEMLGNGNKALTLELQSCLGTPGIKQADFNALRELFGTSAGNFICHDYKAEDSAALLSSLRALDHEAEDAPPLEVSALKKGSISRVFGVSSYSAVTSGLHESGTPEQSDAAADRAGAARKPEEIASPDCFSFPAGTEPGTFLHTLLQDCNFPALSGSDFDLRRALFEEVRKIQGEALIDSWYRRTSREAGRRVIMPEALDEALEPLERWFSDITLASLPGLDDFCLRSLKKGDWIPEMDFLVPTARVSVERINALCVKSADETFPRHEILRLNEKTLCGFVTGSLDLVFRAPAGGRVRYFVADYKSTLLGRGYEDYSPDKITASVFDPRNRYDVQYLFYSLALHRFLKTRIRDYSYERDFGGVFYLYLRGMRAGDDGSGIFYTKPSLGIIEELEALFDGSAKTRRERS